MQRTKPPFRADHVGSLLRPAELKAARERHERGEITPDALRVVEDRAIVDVIRKQEAIGLKSITDGEFRRAFWNYDFLGQLDGVEAYLGERKIKFQGVNPKPMMLRVTGKLGAYTPHPMIEHFRYLQEHCKETAKMTIPSPSSLHFRYGRDAVPEAIYPNMDDFYRDLGQSYNKAVHAFADARRFTFGRVVQSKASQHWRNGQSQRLSHQRSGGAIDVHALHAAAGGRIGDGPASCGCDGVKDDF